MGQVKVRDCPSPKEGRGEAAAQKGVCGQAPMQMGRKDSEDKHSGHPNEHNV